MNNQHKIMISLHGVPLKKCFFFFKKRFSWETNFFVKKFFGEVALNGRTNDQIIPRWGRSFINDKCILQ